MRLFIIATVLACLPGIAAAQEKIVIDPGHGQQDPGGTGNGLQEKNIVLDVSLRFRDLLNADSADTAGGGTWTVALTRTDDTFVSLSGRAAFANNQGADRFISIHSNAFGDPSANGTETFSFTNGSTGANLRNMIQDEMIKAWGLTNRGNKTANFAVLRETAMPAALHELAFITNSVDVQKLNSPEERQKAAAAHLFGLQRHYSIAPHLPGAAPDAGSVSGQVVDIAGPVEGALVTIGERQQSSDAEGRFSFDGLQPGSYTVQVDSAAHRPDVREVQVAAGQVAELVIELSPAGDGDGDGDDEDPDAEPEGGCSTAPGGGAPLGAALVLLALALVTRRRRSAAGSR